MVFVIFIPSTFTHFILTLTKADSNKKIILGNYLISSFLCTTAYTKLFASDIGPFLVFPYWLKPRFLFGIHTIHFFANVIYAHFLMIQTIKNQSGIFRNQILYVFIGTAIGYSAGAINYLTWYRIPVGPFLNPLVSIFVAFAGYAIYKYRLMDINLVFRSGLIFLPYVVISVVVFVTINILFHRLPWLNMGGIVLLILSTPFIYQYLERHSRAVVDSTIYKNKFVYVEKLEEFIDGIPFIPREKDLFKKTVETSSEALGVKKIAIFTYDAVSDDYLLRDQLGLDKQEGFSIPSNNGIVSWLKKNREVFVKEEMEKVMGKDELRSIEEVMMQLGASVCIPVMLKETLTGIITLGEKTSGGMYSHIDTRILHRLGNQLALALDYKRMEVEFRKEHELAVITRNRLNAITTMSYGLADRINNYLMSITVFLGEFTEMLKQFEDKLPDKIKESLKTHYSASSGGLDKMIRLSREITNICKSQGLNMQLYEPKIIMDIVSEVIEDLKPATENKEIKMDKRIEGTPPSSCFDREAIKKVLWHLIQNSIHAILEGKKGLINVKVAGPITREEREFLRIIVEDNGIGIPRENVENIFNPFFTTKGTSGGLGLGLTICQFIVNQHEGIIEVVHSILDKGTTIQLDLPVITEPPKPAVDYKDILGMFPARRKL